MGTRQPGTWFLVCLLLAGGNLLQAKEACEKEKAEQSRTAELTIIDDGKAKATIVLGSDPSDSEKAAARELQTYFWKITSHDGREAQKLPVITETEAAEGTRIFVGRSSPVERMKLGLDDLDARGFMIQTADGNLVLCGKDDLGTEFAVYTFLERHCGIRWLWPGRLGEHIPHQRTLKIASISERQEPDFKLTLLGSDPLWKKRNKLLGGPKFVGGHNWAKMVPPDKYGPKHPEYFALCRGTRERDWNGYDGQHGYQLCTTNPDVLKICVDHVRKFFDRHPKVDMYSVAPNDGAGWCECERCRALDTGEKANRRRVVTDRVFLFTNQIAAELKKSHPDKYLAQLAYQACLEPPRTVRPADNVVVMITVNCEGNYAAKHKENHWRLLQKWSKLTRSLFVYEYFTHTWKLQLPRAMPKAVGDAIPYYRKCGATRFYAQSMNDFATEGLNYYIAAKLLWNTDLDTDLDVEQIVDDYCEKAFGNAAGVMRKYFYRLEELWAAAMRTQDYWHHGSGHSAGNPDNYLRMFTPEVMQELEGYLCQARRLAQPGQFRHRVEFMLKGWKFTELEVEAFSSLRRLAKKGIIAYPPGAAAWRGKVKDPSTLDIPEQEAKRLIADAISAWQERDRYVGELEGSCVIDTHHVKAWNCTDYRFHPVERLKRALQRSASGLD